MELFTEYPDKYPIHIDNVERRMECRLLWIVIVKWQNFLTCLCASILYSFSYMIVCLRIAFERIVEKMITILNSVEGQASCSNWD